MSIRIGILGYGNLGRGVEWRAEAKPGHGAYRRLYGAARRTSKS